MTTDEIYLHPPWPVNIYNDSGAPLPLPPCQFFFLLARMYPEKRMATKLTKCTCAFLLGRASKQIGFYTINAYAIIESSSRLEYKDGSKIAKYSDELTLMIL